MSPLRARPLVAVVVVCGVVAWVLLDALDDNGSSVPLPWTVPALLLALAAVVVGVGWPVRRWNQGHRDRPLDALRAARTVVLAQAAGVTGAALAGAYGGLVGLLLPQLDIEVRRERLLTALVALAAGLVLLAAGVVVERWCRLPPDDREEGRGAPGGRPRDAGSGERAARDDRRQRAAVPAARASGERGLLAHR